MTLGNPRLATEMVIIELSPNHQLMLKLVDGHLIKHRWLPILKVFHYRMLTNYTRENGVEKP